MTIDSSDLEWIFSGIGTYWVQILVGLFVFLFVGKKVKETVYKTKVEGDNYNIKQGGICNKLKFTKKDK